MYTIIIREINLLKKDISRTFKKIFRDQNEVFKKIDELYAEKGSREAREAARNVSELVAAASNAGNAHTQLFMGCWYVMYFLLFFELYDKLPVFYSHISVYAMFVSFSVFAIYEVYQMISLPRDIKLLHDNMEKNLLYSRDINKYHEEGDKIKIKMNTGVRFRSRLFNVVITIAIPAVLIGITTFIIGINTILWK